MNECTKNDMMARVLAGLETTPQTIEDINRSLKERGYNPETEIASFKSRLVRMVAQYTWKTEALAKREAFARKVSALRSWATKTDTEINKAFEQLVNGDFGQKSHEQIALAFRNLEAVTREEKVAILDDLALLTHDDNSQDHTSC